MPLVLVLLKQDTSKSASITAKKMAGLDDKYRSALLDRGIKMR